MVDVSRSRPVMGVYRCHTAAVLAQLRFGGNLQVDAQRVERLAHRVDDQLVFVAVLGRLGQRRAAGPVGVGVGQSRRRTRERAAGHLVAAAGPPAARGSRRPARCPSTPARRRSGRRNTRWPRDRRRQAVQRWFVRPAVRRPPDRSARASTTLCRPLPGSLQPSQRRPDARAVLVGRRASSPRSAPAAAGAVGQSGSASVNRTDCGRISAAGCDMSNGNAPNTIGVLCDAKARRARRPVAGRRCAHRRR